MRLVDVHVYPRAGLKIPFPGLIRYPGSVEIEIPEARQPPEYRQTVVADRHVDQMERSQLRQRGDRLTDLLPDELRAAEAKAPQTRERCECPHTHGSAGGLWHVQVTERTTLHDSLQSFISQRRFAEDQPLEARKRRQDLRPAIIRSALLEREFAEAG